MDALGTVANVFGVASFVLEVGKGIEKIRTAISYNRTQAPDDVAKALQSLDMLKTCLEILGSFPGVATNPLIEPPLRKCQDVYRRVFERTNTLLEITSDRNSDAGILLRSWQKVSPHIKNDVDNIRKDVSELSQCVSLLM